MLPYIPYMYLPQNAFSLSPIALNLGPSEVPGTESLAETMLHAVKRAFNVDHSTSSVVQYACYHVGTCFPRTTEVRAESHHHTIRRRNLTWDMRPPRPAHPFLGPPIQAGLWISAVPMNESLKRLDPLLVRRTLHLRHLKERAAWRASGQGVNGCS